MTVRRTRCVPAPLQVRHGFSGVRPRPPHRGQVDIRTNWPKMVWLACWTWPLPPHWGQVVMVFVSLPVPSQLVQGSVCQISTSRSAPATACSSGTCIRMSRSAPRCGPRDACPRAPPPKNASKMSPKPEKSEENPPSNPPPPA